MKKLTAKVPIREKGKYSKEHHQNTYRDWLVVENTNQQT